MNTIDEVDIATDPWAQKENDLVALFICGNLKFAFYKPWTRTAFFNTNRPPHGRWLYPSIRVVAETTNMHNGTINTYHRVVYDRVIKTRNIKYEDQIKIAVRALYKRARSNAGYFEAQAVRHADESRMYGGVFDLYENTKESPVKRL